MNTGYLIVDDRVSGGAMREADVVTCPHCHGQVILNPARTRERASCRKCHRYMCDLCAADFQRTFECLPMSALLDMEQERLFRAQNVGEI